MLSPAFDAKARELAREALARRKKEAARDATRDRERAELDRMLSLAFQRAAQDWAKEEKEMEERLNREAATE